MSELQNTPPNDAVVLINIQKLMKAMDKQSSAQGELRAVKKHLQEKGINTKAAEVVARLMKKDDTESVEDVIQNMTATLQMLEMSGFKLSKRQKDLFDLSSDDPDAQPLEEKAYNDGRRSGLLGEDEAECPHVPGAAGRTKWLEGFKQGEDERKAVLSMKPPAEVIKGEGAGDEQSDNDDDDEKDALVDGDD